MAPPRRLHETPVAVEGSRTAEQIGGFRVRALLRLLPALSIQGHAIGAARHQAIFQFPRDVELVGQQPADQEQHNHDAERDQGAPLATSGLSRSAIVM
jgi:hypothetical protein